VHRNRALKIAPPSTPLSSPTYQFGLQSPHQSTEPTRAFEVSMICCCTARVCATQDIVLCCRVDKAQPRLRDRVYRFVTQGKIFIRCPAERPPDGSPPVAPPTTLDYSSQLS
jgi:hypothetical protein